MLQLLTCIFLLLLSAAMYREASKRNGLLLAAAGDGDEDMKIAGSSFSAPPAVDPAEAETDRFLKQKSAGNIEKARQLGKTFAEALMDCEKAAPIGDAAVISQLERHHRLLLCAYIIKSVITDYSPDSILARTSTKVFNDEIECASEELYRHISDPAAFSLYILWERSNQRDTGEIGRIYARLCGREGDPAVAGDGNRIYRWFLDKCIGIIEAIEYCDIPL